jgi:prefoldin subunit 5
VSPNQLAEQVRNAKRQVRKMKAATPYIFPQHGELQEARRDVKRAKDRLKTAESAWKALGR